MDRSETDEHDFPEHNERGDFRTGSDKSSARNRRALISVRRPKMKGRRGDFEGKADQGHDDADGEKWLDRKRGQLLTNRGQGSGPGHTVNQTDAKKREGAGGAAEEKIFQSGFSRADIGFIESSQHIE